MFKKIMMMFLGLFVVTLAAVGIYGFTIYNQSTSELSKTYKSFGNENKVIDATEPFTMLLLGVDTGSGSREDKWVGNSDTMILLTVNPKTKETTMMSLERDILTKITEDGETYEAKLNAAYARGGAKLAIKTIQDLMDIDIDRYMMINMQGLVQLVDAVGGIEVNNEFDFPISIEEQEPEYKATVPPGRQTINGDQALVYARMRYQDPEGDYGRQKRQREVIQKVVKKVLSLNSVSHYKAILKAVSSNMQTNVDLSSGSIPKLLGYQDAFRKIKTYQLRGEDATLADGGSYQIVTSDHLLEMQNVLRKSLGKKTTSELRTNAYLQDSLSGDTGLNSAISSSSSPSSEVLVPYASQTQVVVETPIIASSPQPTAEVPLAPATTTTTSTPVAETPTVAPQPAASQ